MSVLLNFPVAGKNNQIKTSYQGERMACIILTQNSRLQSVTAKKSQQELLVKNVGMTSTAREENSVGMCVSLSPLSPFSFRQDPNLGNSEIAQSTFRVGLPTSGTVTEQLTTDWPQAKPI